MPTCTCTDRCEERQLQAPFLHCYKAPDAIEQHWLLYQRQPVQCYAMLQNLEELNVNQKCFVYHSLVLQNEIKRPLALQVEHVIIKPEQNHQHRGD
jgi:hypothetical protein